MQLVQRGQQPTDDEQTAFHTLGAKWKGRPLRLRVVGPLVRNCEGHDAVLNSSTFDNVGAAP
jgi:hypothetical protein